MDSIVNAQRRGHYSLLSGKFRNRIGIEPRTLLALLIASAVAAPLLAIFTLAFNPSDDIWQHLSRTVLPHYVSTTVWLMLGVGIGTFTIGTGTAWLVSHYRFPGRDQFQWALLLPLAVPAYVMAYVYTDLLEYSGPLQNALRDWFGWKNSRDYWFPEIRSLGGAISMMTLVLYPYVYLLARTAFQELSGSYLDTGRTLGLNPRQSFFRIALPMARPAIVVGLTLVLMETLNDFGTVDFFAVQTFTAGIYDVWLNMNSTAGAAQLACALLLIVLLLLGLERWGRRKRRYHQNPSHKPAGPGIRLAGRKGWLAFGICTLPLALGFLLPSAILAHYALDFYQESLQSGFLLFAWHSLSLSITGALVALLIGLLLAYGMRLHPSPLLRAATRAASVGYAIPGAVLAVGVMIPLGILDNSIDSLAQSWFGLSTGLLLSGTVVAITCGYVVRFLALSLGTLETGLGRITPSMDGAARTLGLNAGQTLRRVHLPMLRGSLLTAVLMVFVDCMKELPMTVVLRPFNYDTLATFVHQYASDELLEECAFAALAIVAVGVIPVILLSRAIAATGREQLSGGSR